MNDIIKMNYYIQNNISFQRVLFEMILEIEKSKDNLQQN